MDNHNKYTSSAFDIPRLTKYDIFKKVTHKNVDSQNNIEHFDITTTEEFFEAAYCPLPPYCLIEDKEKYIRAAG